MSAQQQIIPATSISLPEAEAQAAGRSLVREHELTDLIWYIELALDYADALLSRFDIDETGGDVVDDADQYGIVTVQDHVEQIHYALYLALDYLVERLP